MSFSKPVITNYQYLPNPVIAPLNKWPKVGNDLNVNFANEIIRYTKQDVPTVSTKE
jgi:hypothetical protein